MIINYNDLPHRLEHTCETNQAQHRDSIHLERIPEPSPDSYKEAVALLKRRDVVLLFLL